MPGVFTFLLAMLFVGLVGFMSRLANFLDGGAQRMLQLLMFALGVAMLFSGLGVFDFRFFPK